MVDGGVVDGGVVDGSGGGCGEVLGWVGWGGCVPVSAVQCEVEL